MSDSQKGHGALFNFLGRFVGAWFVFGGVIFIIYGFVSGGAELLFLVWLLACLASYGFLPSHIVQALMIRRR